MIIVSYVHLKKAVSITVHMVMRFAKMQQGSGS